MRIRESKNLKYDKTTKVLTGEGDYDRLEFQPGVCVLECFERLDDTLVLHFKNKTYAIIRAQNVEGGLEIDVVAKGLSGFIGRTYSELLETNF
jgi:hypothetical protein